MDLAALLKLVVGLAVSGAGLRLTLQAWQLRPTGIRTHGRVVRHEQSFSDEGALLSAPVIAFADEYGNEHRFTAAASTSWRMHDLGEQVPVRYRPGRPEAARLNSPGHNAFLFGAYGGMSAIFLAVGLLVVWSGVRDLLPQG